jgi:hypothetical protein
MIPAESHMGSVFDMAAMILLQGMGINWPQNESRILGLMSLTNSLVSKVFERPQLDTIST